LLQEGLTSHEASRLGFGCFLQNGPTSQSFMKLSSRDHLWELIRQRHQESSFIKASLVILLNRTNDAGRGTDWSCEINICGFFQGVTSVSSGRTEEIYEKCDNGNLNWSKVSNPGYLEYDAGVLLRRKTQCLSEY